MAEVYTNPPLAGSGTTLPYDDARFEWNISALHSQLKSGKAAAWGAKEALRLIRKTSGMEHLIAASEMNVLKMHLKVSRIETHIARKTADRFAREVAFLRSRIKRDSGTLAQAVDDSDIKTLLRDIENLR